MYVFQNSNQANLYIERTQVPSEQKWNITSDNSLIQKNGQNYTYYEDVK